MSIVIRRAFPLVSTLGIALWPSLALAGEPQLAPEAERPRTDIVVSAQRREENGDDVPISLVAIGNGPLRQRGVASLADVAREVPGFSLATSFRGLPVPTLRGVGFNSPNFSAASPVGIAQDDVALPYPAMAEGPLFDLARVEVLKGPQGTLFGRNTTGGLVRLISAAPDGKTEGYVTLSGGSYESHGVQGAIGGALAPALSARLAFTVERADKGWQVSRSRGDRLGRKNRVGARLALRWQSASGAEATLTSTWWRDRSDTQAPQSVELQPQGLVALGFAPEDWAVGAAALGLPASFMEQAYTPHDATEAEWTIAPLDWGGPPTAPVPLDFRKDNRFASVALRAEAPLADGLTLHSQSSYARLRRRQVADVAGWAFENAISRGRGTVTSLAQEVRLAGEGKGLDWTLGAIVTRDRVTDRDEAWVASNTLLQVFRQAAAQAAADAGADPAEQEAALWGFRDYANSTRQTSLSRGIFGQARLALTPTLGLTAGLRHTRDSTRFSGCSRDMGDGSLAAATNAYHTYGGTGLVSAIVPGGCTTFLADLSQGLVRARLVESNLSGRLALDWKLAPHTLAYVTLARGYKSGTFPNIEGNFAVQYDPARQERVETVEAGIKALATGWLDLEGALFHSAYRDKQVFGAIADPVFGALTRVLNVPRAHIWGVEAAAVVRPNQRLALSANLAYLHTRIDRYQGIDDLGEPHDFAGARFAYTPRLQANLSAEQMLALPHGWDATARVALHHAGAQRADLVDDPRYRIPAHRIVNAGLSVRTPGGRLEIQLLVNNLTDSYSWNAVHFMSDGFARYANPPRTWTLSLNRRF